MQYSSVWSRDDANISEMGFLQWRKLGIDEVKAQDPQYI